ncbi:hypothetical protein M758_UG042200 [Ceratodon purpureus]|nr:hypothetical protein M758_UG042200 [Ceratodon purpureus]
MEARFHVVIAVFPLIYMICLVVRCILFFHLLMRHYFVDLSSHHRFAHRCCNASVACLTPLSHNLQCIYPASSTEGLAIRFRSYPSRSRLLLDHNLPLPVADIVYKVNLVYMVWKNIWLHNRYLSCVEFDRPNPVLVAAHGRVPFLVCDLIQEHLSAVN